MLPLKTILCPTDFSDFSFQALKKGAELAYRCGAELCVLHVTPELQNAPQVTPFADFAGVDVSNYESDMRTGAENALAAFIQRPKTSKVGIFSGTPAPRTISVPAQDTRLDIYLLHPARSFGFRFRNGARGVSICGFRFERFSFRAVSVSSGFRFERFPFRAVFVSSGFRFEPNSLPRP